MAVRGIVFNIQRFSIQDGPGIRTTVFLKGCFLTCKWCHNPESQNSYPELAFKMRSCIGCQECLDCPRAAIKWTGNTIKIERDICDNCGYCATLCPSEALIMIGEEMFVADVMAEVLKDRVFYQRSNGGLTISGGEPFFQFMFLKELLAAARSEGLHTAIETCGYTDWRKIEDVSGLVDLFLYDLKALDPERHRKITGISNEKIISNLERLLQMGKEVIVRIPVVPPHNFIDSGDIEDLLVFLQKLRKNGKDFGVDLLPYNELTASKYQWLGKEYSLEVGDPNPLVKEFKNKLKSLGFKVSVGGLS